MIFTTPANMNRIETLNKRKVVPLTKLKLLVNVLDENKKGNREIPRKPNTIP